MRNAYALLGLAFIIVFGSAYILFRQSVEAPSPAEVPAPETSLNTTETMSLSLTSTAFIDGETIPREYTCDGDNINPPLSIAGVPEGTQSLVLVMDDLDIPEAVKNARGIEKFDHWVLYDLPADTEMIEPGATIGTLGKNSTDALAYTGPCPPPNMEPTTHRYIFRLYALRDPINFITAPTLDELEEAVKDGALDSAELIGVYSRAETGE